MISGEGSTVIRQVPINQNLEDRAVNAFLAETFRKQENREAVTQETIAALMESSSSEKEPADNFVQLDDDWLNLFSAYAERASTQRFQNLWGRILAGEIRKPSSFSLSTLRIISELDKSIASLFQEVVADRLSIGDIPTPPELSGKTLDDLNFLEEVGLLQGVASNIQINISKSEDGYYYLPNYDHYLRVELSRNQDGWEHDGFLKFQIINITRAGKEILSILPEENHERALRAAAKSLVKRPPLGADIVSILLCKTIPNEPSQMLHLVGQLYPIDP